MPTRITPPEDQAIIDAMREAEHRPYRETVAYQLELLRYSLNSREPGMMVELKLDRLADEYRDDPENFSNYSLNNEEATALAMTIYFSEHGLRRVYSLNEMTNDPAYQRIADNLAAAAIRPTKAPEPEASVAAPAYEPVNGEPEFIPAQPVLPLVIEDHEEVLQAIYQQAKVRFPENLENNEPLTIFVPYGGLHRAIEITPDGEGHFTYRDVTANNRMSGNMIRLYTNLDEISPEAQAISDLLADSRIMVINVVPLDELETGPKYEIPGITDPTQRPTLI
jgi:hypothetical protein